MRGVSSWRREIRFLVALIGAIVGEEISSNPTEYFHLMVIAAIIVWVIDENKGETK